MKAGALHCKKVDCGHLVEADLPCWRCTGQLWSESQCGCKQDMAAVRMGVGFRQPKMGKKVCHVVQFVIMFSWIALGSVVLESA